jgi:hypothetical protein
MNAASTTPIKPEGQGLEEIESFTYLGSIVNKQERTDVDVKIRIGKAIAVFLQLEEVWTPGCLSTNTKIRLINTNVKSILLYGAET